jgi:GNAT superfamily N-acetyltransferase
MRMPAQLLDNPFFSALDSIHRGVALQHGEVRRYPAEFAPFLGIPHADVALADALDALVPAGDSVLMLGVAPTRLPGGWRLESFADLAQLHCEREIDVIDGPEIIELGECHRADVLALTALVYPHYFRPRTMELGRYFGMYVPDERGDIRLAAIIGERLGTPDAREMSAICTHPDFLGRGYARRLTAFLTNETLRAGKQPFLHVAYSNARAKALYERMGYTLRRDIPFMALRRG